MCDQIRSLMLLQVQGDSLLSPFTLFFHLSHRCCVSFSFPTSPQCIDAFVRRNDEDAAERAEAIVERMTKLYEKGLGHVKPTTDVFNVVLNAWSRSNEEGAAEKAEKIFQWMEEQYRAGDDLVRPNEVSLCAVLNAWANHAENGGAERAVQIWEHMDSVSDEERGFRPTIAIPNTVSVQHFGGYLR